MLTRLRADTKRLLAVLFASRRAGGGDCELPEDASSPSARLPLPSFKSLRGDFRSQSCSQASLLAVSSRKSKPVEGFEPSAYSLRRNRSSQSELHRQTHFVRLPSLTSLHSVRHRRTRRVATVSSYRPTHSNIAATSFLTVAKVSAGSEVVTRLSIGLQLELLDLPARRPGKCLHELDFPRMFVRREVLQTVALEFEFGRRNL